MTLQSRSHVEYLIQTYRIPERAHFLLKIDEKSSYPDVFLYLNRNSSSKQHSIMSVQPNIVTCLMNPEKFLRDNVVAPFSQLSVVILILPSKIREIHYAEDQLPWVENAPTEKSGGRFPGF